MRPSIYSTAWDVAKRGFDYKGALDNWAVYASEIVVAVPAWDDHTASLLRRHAGDHGHPLVVVPSYADFENDPFAYGKTENTALQACRGEVLVQQNLDERLLVSRERLNELARRLQSDWSVSAFFVPTIDLYGSQERYLNLGYKWRIHRAGFYRGPANGTLKSDGRPDYNKTSTDELIDIAGNLAPTVNLLPDLTIENLRTYVAAGWPVSFHLGYLSLKDRLDRSLWWRAFWERATNGDPNQHPTSIEEMAAKETREHGLPLWPTTNETVR